MTDVRAHGLWFEEFTEGLSIETRGRTITETDVVNFAGVSGDFNPMHTDAEFAKTTQFGARVAHGALVFSIATGLAYQLGFLEATVIAFLSYDWKLRAPVYIGDTVKVSATVAKRRAMSAAGGGMVTFDVKVTNQKGEVTQKGEWVIMVKSKPADSEGSAAQPA
ncbi:MAG: MaoC family dehydratase N-terminal domain-containing protein [Anaerolineae bacterium]|nr:MaoC family dehydratase N-terminal domain-containing protein [Anaerolineae bacterium]